MSDLTVSSADRLHQLRAITPPKEIDQTPPVDETRYESQAEISVRIYKQFWEGLLTLFIKIPLIKNLTLTIWRFGLWSLQPTNPIKSETSLLFNSSIEIPKWFNEEMHHQASLTLRRHFLAELKMVQEKAPADLNTIIRLSQVKVSRELYNYPEIIQELEKGLSETTHTMITKIREKHPYDPLQIHLGGNSFESPIERRPLTGLFMQSFADCLKENDIPIRFLHLHGPCDNNEALPLFLEGLKNCPSLYHLHLDLDEAGSKKVFETLGRSLKETKGLQELVFRNYARDHKFWVLDEHWVELAEAINSHRTLKTLSFYDLPEPPEVFRNALRGFTIEPIATSQQGFCIKKD